MRRLLLLLLCFWGQLSAINSQVLSGSPSVQVKSVATKRTVSGNIVDKENGQPLPGVSVLIKGTAVGTITDAKGLFTLVVPDNAAKIVLVISSLNFESREITVAGTGEIRRIPAIALQKSTASLDEVVVMGYGSIEKRKMIGSVSSYQPEMIGARPLSVGDMLNGKLAGVQVTTASGVPGAATAITIRGVSTISNAGNAPLIVLDGVPMYGLENASNTTSYAGTNPGIPFNAPGAGTIGGYNTTNSFERSPLTTLNPDDIESIEVLKDAFATAIYGSRGASGVILITTKKGRTGTSSVNIQYNTSMVQAFAKPKVMTGDQYADFYNTVLDTMRNNPPTTSWPGSLGYFRKGINTNWLDKVIRNGIGHNLNASLSGGTDRTHYFFSAGYNEEESYIINQKLTRAQSRLNIDQKLSDNFKIGISLGISQTNNNALNAQAVYTAAVTAAPNVPVQDSLGAYLWRPTATSYYGYTTTGYNSYGPTQDINPVGSALTGTNYMKDTRSTGNMYAEFKLNTWLTARTEFGMDWLNSRGYSRLIDKVGTPKGLASETVSSNNKYVITNLLTVNKLIGKHQVQGVVGQSFEKSVEGLTVNTGSSFFNDQILSIGAASVKSVVQNLQQSWALFSAFTRMSYTYDARYMVGFTYRVDGSSRFAQDRRFLQFPSFALGWVVSNEKFMKQVKAINELKVRSSIGFAGTDGGRGYYGPFGQYSLNGTNTYGTTALLQMASPANPDLKWQRTRTIDAGIDAKLFNNKVTVTIDYYHKYTSNMLSSAPVPGYLGFYNSGLNPLSTLSQNYGEMRNSGFEVSLTSKNIDTRNFKWSTTFNIGHNENVITKLYDSDTLKNAVANKLSNGRIMLPGVSATAFYLYNWGGVNPANGNPVWKAPNGTTSEIPFDLLYSSALNAGVLTNQQRVYSGDALPKFFGGIENRVSFKNIDFGCFVSYAYGQKLFNGAKAALYNYTSSTAPNLSPELLNYWRTSGQISDIPALNNASSLAKTAPGVNSAADYTLQRTSDRFLEDASYIKLRNVTIAYNFPGAVLERWGIRKTNIRIFCEANNVVTISRYSGIDPEVSAYGSSALASGFDELTMPNPRTYRVGFKVGF